MEEIEPRIEEDDKLWLGTIVDVELMALQVAMKGLTYKVDVVVDGITVCSHTMKLYLKGVPKSRSSKPCSYEHTLAKGTSYVSTNGLVIPFLSA